MLHRIRDRRTASLTMLLTVGLASTAPAWSQTRVAAADSLEEIVVTARKTSESLQTTPVAVTALTETALTERQVLQVTDLQRTTPSLAIGGAGTGPSSIVYLSLRGEAQNSPNSASDAAVGIYIDGVYIGRPIVGNLGVLDIARAEVLRGPQGTLFGRNTTGGALNITSNQPNGKFEGSVKVGYGNYNDKLAQGVLNVPILGDELAVRVAVRYNKHDARYENLGGGPDLDGLDHDYTARGQVRWAPSSIPLTLVISGDYDQMRDSGTPTSLVGFNPRSFGGAFAAALAPYVGNYRHTYSNPLTGDPAIDTPYNRNKAKGVSANLDVDLGPVHVKSITAYRESDTADAVDLDGTPIKIGSFVSFYKQHQGSEELQVSGKIDRLDLIGGLMYFKEGGFEESDSQVLPAFQGGIFNSNAADFDATSKAIFTQANYHITDTFRVTAGYRYTKDDRDLNRHGKSNIVQNICGVPFGNPTPAGLPCSDPKNASFTYPAWVLGADWQATDQLFFYAKTSRASMAGGFNTRPVPPTASDSIKPETNKDVEIGMKADLLDRRLRTNVALFHAWQSDVQRIVNAVFTNAATGVTSLTQYVANSGKSKTYGAELEISALPWTGMEVNFSGSYLHAAYVKGSFKSNQNIGSAAAPVIVSVDRSDEPIPQAPEYTVSLGATQTVPMSFGNTSFHLDYAWRDDVYYTYETPAPGQPANAKFGYDLANKFGFIPAYGLLNGRIALTLDNPNLEFSLYGRNLTNKEYYTQQFNSANGLSTVVFYQGVPRTWGGTVEYKF